MRKLDPKDDTKLIALRITKKQAAKVEREAKRLGVSVSQYIRERLAA